MNIKKAKAISSYWNEERHEELTWLGTQAESRGMIAEIGACTGCTTRALADSTPGSVYAIDTWDGGTDDELTLGINLDYAGWEGCYQAFLKNTAGLPNLTVMRMGSLDAAARLLRTAIRFDMIFIDASHDYESVKSDILAWRLLLAPSGLLCGHDFFDRYPGVIHAVKETTEGRWKHSGAGTIWQAL